MKQQLLALVVVGLGSCEALEAPTHIGPNATLSNSGTTSETEASTWTVWADAYTPSMSRQQAQSYANGLSRRIEDEVAARNQYLKEKGFYDSEKVTLLISSVKFEDVVQRPFFVLFNSRQFGYGLHPYSHLDARASWAEMHKVATDLLPAWYALAKRSEGNNADPEARLYNVYEFGSVIGFHRELEHIYSPGWIAGYTDSEGLPTVDLEGATKAPDAFFGNTQRGECLVAANVHSHPASGYAIYQDFSFSPGDIGVNYLFDGLPAYLIGVDLQQRRVILQCFYGQIHDRDTRPALYSNDRVMGEIIAIVPFSELDGS